MTAIWPPRRGRSLFRKHMDYLALLLLLPLSINIALAAEAIVANRRMMEYVGLIVPSAWLAALLIKLVPFLCVVLTRAWQRSGYRFGAEWLLRRLGG